MLQNTTFISALKDHFGFQPGQGLMQFRDEVKALTEKDRAELKEGLEKIGYTFKPE
jgi:uncharacterized protein YcgL (UPF0745 family)